MIKFLSYIIVILIIISGAYLYLFQTPTKVNKQVKQAALHDTKPVVMIIIDSVMDQPLQTAIKEGKAPALEFLLEHGRYYPQVVSSFPTMSVSIDSTLLTGTYPDQHKVPALVWYDDNTKRFISYGSAWKEILKLGPKQVFQDSVLRLNEQYLSKNVKTIHEELDGETASINTLVYRGNDTTTLQVPRILSLLGFLHKNQTVETPAYFSYGLLSSMNPNNKYTNLWQAFGFNDKFSATELKYLIEKDSLPSFSLVYFSDNDKQVHKNGPTETIGIEEADKRLQELFSIYETKEDALREVVWIVMGDSGQSDIKEDKQDALIDLRKLLHSYNIHKLSEPIQAKDQIVLGLNERMCFIYLNDNKITKEEITALLKNDTRIDIIAWKDGDVINIISGEKPGVFSFKPNGNFFDQYGQSWTLEGNEQILDLEIEGNQIVYREYPDGLARLYSSFFSHTGNYLVVNAKDGYEFVGEGSPTHVGGGSHGGLNKEDSYFPMIVVGTNLEPKHERMIDLKEWILRIVNENRMKENQ